MVYTALLRQQGDFMSAGSEAQLPEDGPAEIAGFALTSGHRVRGSLPPTTGDPVMWATDAAMESPGSIWRELDSAAMTLGLSAVLLENLRTGEGRPWDSGEFVRVEDPNPDAYDAADMFRQQWNASVPLGSLAEEDRPDVTALFPHLEGREFEEDDEETSMFLEILAPWGLRFPGLALAERTSGDGSRYEEAIRHSPAARIGLVATSRPADIPAVIGWAGVVNHFQGDHGPVVLSAMMRSWEDRFGARLFRLGFDTMDFLVERPPSSEASALAVAAEHFSFAGTDGLNDQGLNSEDEPITTLGSLAKLILGNPIWHFWWD